MNSQDHALLYEKSKFYYLRGRDGVPIITVGLFGHKHECVARTVAMFHSNDKLSLKSIGRNVVKTRWKNCDSILERKDFHNEYMVENLANALTRVCEDDQGKLKFTGLKKIDLDPDLTKFERKIYMGQE